MDKPTVKFRFSIVKVLIMVVFSLILAIGFITAAIKVPMHPVLQIVLVLGGSFFTLWALGIGSHVLKRDVILSFGPIGIFDRRIGPNAIPWGEIDEIYMFRARSQRFLAVVVTGPDHYPPPRHWADKLSMRINGLVGLPRFSLAMLGLRGSTSQILEAMLMHLPEQFDHDTILR